MTILQLNSSLFNGGGQSSLLAHQYVAFRRAAEPSIEVIVRDLARQPVPHLDGERFQAFVTAPEARTSDQQAIVDFSDALIDEIRRADTIVLGLPMYNFGIPSQLKAYFDHIARAGITFRYTEHGPEGLLKGKKAVVLATRGGQYAGTPKDTQTTYVKDFLAFIGITDVEFVYAEGLAMGEASKIAALGNASTAIERLVMPTALAA